ncbi:MAG: type II secretion system F family protein [archaeon]
MGLYEILESLSLTSIASRVSNLFPDLKKQIWIAQINQKPEDYVKSKLKNGFMVAAAMAILTFFLVDKTEKSYWWILVSFLGFFMFVFITLMKTASARAIKKQKEIDREVLFAGRFLLVKLNSGKPLISALIDASKSYGVANHYFKSIVHEIDLGTPLEDALFKSIKFCPSEKMKKILFQIISAIKIGIDISVPLQSTLDQIAEEQLLEIKRYGKKLSSVTMFYMLGAVVMPSLGLTMFVIIASIVNFQADTTLFLTISFFLIVIELIFISIFRSIRPNVNI